MRDANALTRCTVEYHRMMRAQGTLAYFKYKHHDFTRISVRVERFSDAAKRHSTLVPSILKNREIISH